MFKLFKKKESIAKFDSDAFNLNFAKLQDVKMYLEALTKFDFVFSKEYFKLTNDYGRECINSTLVVFSNIKEICSFALVNNPYVLAPILAKHIGTLNVLQRYVMKDHFRQFATSLDVLEETQHLVRALYEDFLQYAEIVRLDTEIELESTIKLLNLEKNTMIKSKLIDNYTDKINVLKDNLKTMKLDNVKETTRHHLNDNYMELSKSFIKTLATNKKPILDISFSDFSSVVYDFVKSRIASTDKDKVMKIVLDVATVKANYGYYNPSDTGKENAKRVVKLRSESKLEFALFCYLTTEYCRTHYLDGDKILIRSDVDDFLASDDCPELLDSIQKCFASIRNEDSKDFIFLFHFFEQFVQSKFYEISNKYTARYLTILYFTGFTLGQYSHVSYDYFADLITEEFDVIKGIESVVKDIKKVGDMSYSSYVEKTAEGYAMLSELYFVVEQLMTLPVEDLCKLLFQQQFLLFSRFEYNQTTEYHAKLFKIPVDEFRGRVQYYNFSV